MNLDRINSAVSTRQRANSAPLPRYLSVHRKRIDLCDLTTESQFYSLYSPISALVKSYNMLFCVVVLIIYILKL